MLGGGNVKLLKTLPPKCRAGNNANAFIGGYRLWETPTALAEHIALSPVSIPVSSQAVKAQKKVKESAKPPDDVTRRVTMGAIRCRWM